MRKAQIGKRKKPAEPSDAGAGWLPFYYDPNATD
jgi:hypothetical protein